MAKNEIMPVTSGTICIFNDPKIGNQFSSFSPDTMDGKIKLYNAINSPDGRLGDYINTPITVKDVVICQVKLTERVDAKSDDWSEENKERDGFRVVLLDTEGASYTATSTGIYNSICTLRNVFGTLHFEDGLKMQVKQIQTKNGKTLTLSLCD